MTPPLIKKFLKKDILFFIFFIIFYLSITCMRSFQCATVVTSVTAHNHLPSTKLLIIKNFTFITLIFYLFLPHVFESFDQMDFLFRQHSGKNFTSAGTGFIVKIFQCQQCKKNFFGPELNSNLDILTLQKFPIFWKFPTFLEFSINFKLSKIQEVMKFSRKFYK